MNDTARIQPSVRCRTSDQCLDPRFPVCSLGQCIAPCERDADCSAPYDRCLRGRCAIAVVGASCDSDADCGGTFDRCIHDLAPDGPVCTTRCRTDADCPFLASHCVTRGAERFCAPDRATSGAICRALVAAGRAIACDAGGACPGGARCYRAGDLALCLSPPSPEGCAGEDEILRHDAQGNAVCVPSLDGLDVVAACECVLGAEGSLLDEGLARIGRHRCSVSFPLEVHRSVYDRAPMLAAIAEDPFRLSFTSQLHGDWLAVPSFAAELARSLDAAAVGMIRTIEAAGLETLRGQHAELTVDTPLGRIAIRGAGADTYEGEDWNATLFVLDLGGDDTYRVPVGATTSIDHGVSIAIDLGGADDYGYPERPVASDVGPEGHLRLPSDGAGRAIPGDTNGPFSLSNVGRQGSGRHPLRCDRE